MDFESSVLQEIEIRRIYWQLDFFPDSDKYPDAEEQEVRLTAEATLYEETRHLGELYVVTEVDISAVDAEFRDEIKRDIEEWCNNEHLGLSEGWKIDPEIIVD